ncbi:hypothetical protein [Herbaspirillum sp. SJZ107]|uniref:hypothetical protein n=1 Tax=Herbaspirillum sp. SJZ107 TaxID=2572881 RepID=UPI001151F2E5|nr:hypothetical protein [Herbaspirillum sp. SJZ107]TQK07083.1 hypothetical protein FBX97_2352 [Herbaspirillum sp. SJZ107]
MTPHRFLKRLHAAALVGIALALPVQAQTTRGPATPEEAAHVAQIASASDKDPVALAGLEGVLRAYENMLPTHRGIRSAELDAALAARDRGTLAQFVAALPPMPRR